MFQYATARRLAYAHGAELRLDVSGFNTDPLRSYSLGPYRLKQLFASESDIASISRQRHNVFYKWLVKLLLPGIVLFRERQFFFDPSVLRLGDHVYLDGYWQSEKYFHDISDILKNDFSLAHEPTGRNKALAALISASQSVSLHIRRGDYVSAPLVNKKHGTYEAAYYRQCIEHMNKAISDPHFFVFSDDPQWVLENFDTPVETTVVSHNDGGSAPEDLRLMSRCKHNIIANSTFSWWGAWLNSHSDKIICAPAKWFATGHDPLLSAKDLLPESWLKF